MGRRAVLDVLLHDRQRAGLTVVCGLPGSGKSALLEEVRRELFELGATVLEVSFRGDRPEWDSFGVSAVLTAVRDQFELLATDARLLEALEAVSRLWSEETYGSSWARFRLLRAVSNLFARLSATGPMTILLDDADSLADPVLALASIHRAGHPIVATCRLGPDGEPGLSAGLADRMLELEPLSEDETATLLRRTMNAPVDAAAEKAVRKALGPLWGNPGTLLSTMAELRHRGRLALVNGLICLREPEKPVSLPAGHHLFEVLAPFGEAADQVVLLAASPEGLRVEEVPLLSAAAGPALDHGRAVDQLVLAGVLDCTASGLLRCRFPGLGAAIAERAGSRQRLHREMAERMLVDGPPESHQTPVLASHVAGAGQTLPRRPELVEILREAEEMLGDTDHRVRTDYRYAAWWHAGGSAARAGLQTSLIRHLVRAADYPALARFVPQALEGDPGSAERAELAVVAALAALHLGRPVAASVREGLTGRTAVPAPVEFADRWFAGEPVWPDQIAACFNPAWRQADPGGRFPRPRRLDGRIADACATRDLVPVFGSVLGPDYRTPSGGPLAAYHRVCAGHADGRWDDALSAARELEIRDDVDEAAREHARLLAAEMCGWRGEDRRAAEWLAAVGEAGRFPLLKTWVEAGSRYHGGDPVEAFKVGWRACHADAGEADEFGASRLLPRLAWLAARAARPDWSASVLGMAQLWHSRSGSQRSSETVVLVRGLLEADETGIRAAEKLVRRRGEALDLVLVCQASAQVAGAPQRRLREAYEIAQSVGATRLIGQAKRAMEGHGIAVPVTRARRQHLSDTELAIIEEIRQGRTNRQIARAVRISEKTVEKYLTRLYAKAGCRTRHALAISDLGRRRDAIGA
ncbi:helix-turn-helix transcriptional regulator [Amycolatopsis pigmentata]|uniref:LuxR C-terminal-related transcriptional regulator n=1 Tax=Amycolatopsis pigmentata TaxID=450801 RepID=A0ABW5G2C8_9PSEU